jgi:acyl-coenzyme A synthetase/AMP-(fatty) acid ligase
MSTLQAMAARILERDPAQPVIEFQKQWVSSGEMRHVAERVNALIDASGADPRAPVAFVPRNRPAVLSALVGLITRGRHIRMIHAYQAPVGIARDIARLKPAVVVAPAADFSDEVKATLAEQGIAGVALDGMEAQAVEGLDRSTAECDAPPPSPQFDLLTSGTTGPPKQFPLTYDFIARDLVGMNVTNAQMQGDPIDQPPAYLYYPLGNFSGLYSNLAPLLQGFRGFLTDRFTMAECHDYLVRFRPNWLGVPPAGVQMILDADIPAADLASVECLRTGSAPLPLASHRAFEERYGIPILIAYGATEFGGPVTMMTLELYAEWGKKKLGTVGRPFGGSQIRVIDPQTGEILPPGVEGVLEVVSGRMGPNWIRTSDLAVIDEDGFLWHRGRADGAIMRGGFKVLPEAIEQALMLHETVAVAAVTGVPDRRLGQVPAVAIQLKPGARKPSVEELDKHLRQHVESTFIPVIWRFVDSLPYTAMMKPDRIALRKVFETETAG